MIEMTEAKVRVIEQQIGQDGETFLRDLPPDVHWTITHTPDGRMRCTETSPLEMAQRHARRAAYYASQIGEEELDLLDAADQKATGLH
jgi:hypothetical protein